MSLTADGKELPASAWSYGEFHGASGVLRIHREAARKVIISATTPKTSP